MSHSRARSHGSADLDLADSRCAWRVWRYSLVSVGATAVMSSNCNIGRVKGVLGTGNGSSSRD